MAPKQSRLSREAILASARAVVLSDGSNALSLRPLAARLGVTAPALYAHFENKEALLTALAEEEFAQLIYEIEDSTVGAAEPLARIKAQCHAYVNYAVANPALFEIIFEFRPAWAPAPSATELPLASKAFEISAVAVEDAIAAGLMHERDPLLASLTIWAAVHGVATLLAAQPQLGDAYEAALVASVIDNVLLGLTTARPHTAGDC